MRHPEEGQASNGKRVCRTCDLQIRWVPERETWVHSATGEVEGMKPAPPPGGWASPKGKPTAYLVHEARPAG